VTSADPAALSHHRALLYASRDELVVRIGDFVGEGLQAGDETVLTATPATAAGVREHLGDASRRLIVAHTEAAYADPMRMLSDLAVRLNGRREAGAPRLRLATELVTDGWTRQKTRAVMQFEAVANVLYAAESVEALCAFDASALGGDLLHDVRRTHPLIVEGDGDAPSGAFDATAELLAERPATGPALDALRFPIQAEADLRPLRAYVRAEAQYQGVGGESLDRLLVALSEVALNALRHGRPPQTVLIWTSRGALVCEVRDAGPGLPDPLTGFLPPLGDRDDGRGLWLARQLCDVMRAYPLDPGFAVRLETALPGR
jgi:anti-sigma regulatory factor (Ser/Thr protein kinase)